MPKKLKIDSLESEITSVSNLLEMADSSGDVVGSIQFKKRLEQLSERLADLKSHSLKDNNASVALFFGGKPVLGSKGIAAKFAGTILEQLQALISKTYAKAEVGELGERGSVPFKAQSELMVTGLARGSFGFVLNEMSDQTDIDKSALSKIIEEVASMLQSTSAKDSTIFESLVESLDGRTLLALKEFFHNLDANGATLRIVEGDHDFTLDGNAIHRGRIRTEEITIDEETLLISGKLVGFLPEHQKFEIETSDKSIIYGSVSKEATEQFKSFIKESGEIIGSKCEAEIIKRTVRPLNRSPKEVIKLVKFVTSLVSKL